MSLVLAPLAGAESDGPPGRIFPSWIVPVDTHSVRVGWFAPDLTGRPGADSYTVTAHPSGATCVTIEPGCTIDGLTEQVPHRFVIEATNAHGRTQEPLDSTFVPNLVEVPSGRTTAGRARSIPIPISLRLAGDVVVTVRASGGSLVPVGAALATASRWSDTHVELPRSAGDPPLDAQTALVWKAPSSPGEYTIQVSVRNSDHRTYSAGAATMTVDPVAGAPIGGARVLAPPLHPAAPLDPAAAPQHPAPPLGLPVASSEPIAAGHAPSGASSSQDAADRNATAAVLAASVLVGAVGLVLIDRRRRTRS